MLSHWPIQWRAFATLATCIFSLPLINVSFFRSCVCHNSDTTQKINWVCTFLTTHNCEQWLPTFVLTHSRQISRRSRFFSSSTTEKWVYSWILLGNKCFQNTLIFVVTISSLSACFSLIRKSFRKKNWMNFIEMLLSLGSNFFVDNAKPFLSKINRKKLTCIGTKTLSHDANHFVRYIFAIIFHSA